MRKAVIRIDVDPDGSLSTEDIEDGIKQLEERGITVRRRAAERELILTLDSASRETAQAGASATCETAFGITPELGVVTFASRGTDEDALGVLAEFGVSAEVERLEENGEEIAVVTFSAGQRRRVAESRVHTALEAALNCQIRIHYA